MRWSTTFKKEEIEGGDGRSMLRSAAFFKKEKPRERGLSKGGKQRGDRGQESCRRSCGRRMVAKTEMTKARKAADECVVVERWQKQKRQRPGKLPTIVRSSKKGKKEETEARRAADDRAVVGKGQKQRRQRPGELLTIVRLSKKGKKEETEATRASDDHFCHRHYCRGAHCHHPHCSHHRPRDQFYPWM